MSDTKDLENIENEISLLVKAIKEALIARGEKMATAESCTGGLIASEIVKEPGTSDILAGGDPEIHPGAELFEQTFRPGPLRGPGPWKASPRGPGARSNPPCTTSVFAWKAGA